MANVQYRTPVRIQWCYKKREPGQIEEIKKWVDIGNESETDQPKHKLCRWVSDASAEALNQETLKAIRKATVTMRYDGRITQQCRLIHDKTVYEIESVNDLEDRHLTMVLKVRATEAG